MMRRKVSEKTERKLFKIAAYCGLAFGAFLWVLPAAIYILTHGTKVPP